MGLRSTRSGLQPRTVFAALLLAVVAGACGPRPSPSPSAGESTNGAESPSAEASRPSTPETSLLPIGLTTAGPNDTLCPEPSIQPAPGRPNGWPVALGDYDASQPPVFGPDGTAYFVQNMSLAAVDASGHEPAGWPKPLNVHPLLENGYAPTEIAVGPDGTVYLAGHDIIYAFTRDGIAVPGWPYRASNATSADGWVASLLPVAQGLYTDIEAGQAVLLGKDAKPLPGWPVQVPSSDELPLELSTGPDGTLYVHDLVGGTIDAYGLDGAHKAGWPLRGWSGMTFDPQGRIYLWSHKFGAAPGARYSGPAIETAIGSVDAAGRELAGWPKTIRGAASPPVFGPDGTVYVTRGTSYGPGSAGPVAAGGTILSYDTSGNPKPGWPVSLPNGYWAAGSMPGVSQASSDPPTVGPDGTVYIVAAAGQSDTIVEAYDADGRLVPGWPRDVGAGQLSNVLASDPQTSGWLMSGSAPLIYLVDDNRILALRSDGTMAPGWPLSRPCGAAPEAVQPAPDGGVLVRWNSGSKPYFGSLMIRYRADGSVSS